MTTPASVGYRAPSDGETTSEHASPFARSDDADGSSVEREQEQTHRVDVTPEAAEMLRSLRADHGPLMFHQSGGCCDGSSPMCFPRGDFLTGDSDQLLGTISIDPPDADEPGEPIEVWMSKEQFAYWRHTHLTIDIVPGRGAGFSLEGPTGKRFLIRSRLFTDAEYTALGETPPKVGAQPPVS
jgi:uncharacterized protein (DUF779 family)